MTERIAFVGDIHGTMEPLIQVIERATNEAETVVFLGDYVNRGSNSREVIDILIKLSEDFGERIRFLHGHHDVAFLRAIDEGQVDTFLRMGGAATLSNYPRRSASGSTLPLAERVPRPHLDFLRSLEPEFVGEDCLATHQKADALPLTPGRFGVFGHEPQAARVPLLTDTYALIDTGCGTLTDGRLTCLLWPSREWFQA